MDESERLSCIIALQHELEQQHQKGLEFLLSSFAAACKCHRRASVCRPFPSHLQPNNDYAAVAAALDALSSLSTIFSADSTQTGSSNSNSSSSSSDGRSTHPTDLQLRLLQWLLLQLQLKRGYDLNSISAEQLQIELQAGGCCPPGLLHNLQGCCCILRLDGPGKQQAAPGSCVAAFHGTDFANIHSILHNGLLAASGTRLQTSGAVFGGGIYLSTDFNVAYSFSKGQQGWAGSSIGRHLRCMLLCEVDRELALQGQSSGTPQANSSSLPDRYILVPKPADVLVKYLLVFSDDAMLGLSHGRRRHKGAATCLALTLAYVVAMLLLAAWQTHKSWR